MKTISENVRVITAPNKSPMTHDGTNTYIIGTGKDLCIIDPGPLCEEHYRSIKEILTEENGSHILVTHSHVDHSKLAKRLSLEFSIPIFAHGDLDGARSRFMKELCLSSDNLGGHEGIDVGFQPDYRISDGELIFGAGWELECLHTPGHLSDHFCFAYEKANLLFSGDLVMGWTSTIISPPYGDLSQYFLSLDKLLARTEKTYLPGHGKKIPDACRYVLALKEHRLKREKQVVRSLKVGSANSLEIANVLYKGQSDIIIMAGARNVLAHLINLSERGLVRSSNDISVDTIFELVV